MTSYTLIVNPEAGKGAAAKIAAMLKDELKRRGVAFEAIETTGPHHATEATREASAPIVVAVGGDGTVNEIVNGLDTKTKALGIIPAGSGNDLIKSVGIPRKPLEALDVLLANKILSMDLGSVRCAATEDSLRQSQTHLFVNGVGVGFDAAVAAKTREIPYLSGTALYIAAVLQTLGKFTPPTFRFSFLHTKIPFKYLLVAIGNGRCAGGSFYLTPEAIVDDGLLDICTVQEKTIPEILVLMPKVMRGKHHNVSGVNFFREKELRISAQEPFYVHADGEIVGEDVCHVDVGLLQTRLNVVCGDRR